MPRYLVSFDDGSMDHIPREDLPSVGEAARQVVRDAKAVTSGLLAVRDLAGPVGEDGNGYPPALDLARIGPGHLPGWTARSRGIANEASGFDVAADQANVPLEYAPLGGVDGLFYGEHRSFVRRPRRECRSGKRARKAQQQRESWPP